MRFHAILFQWAFLKRITGSDTKPNISSLCGTCGAKLMHRKRNTSVQSSGGCFSCAAFLQGYCVDHRSFSQMKSPRFFHLNLKLALVLVSPVNVKRIVSNAL